MAGQFSPTTRPLRPGAYFDFTALAPQPVYINTIGIVGLPFTHSWGPANQVVAMQSFSDFLTFYGTGGTTPPAYTPGYMAVRQAFQGEGLPGRGGAGEVLGYRMVGSGGLAASTTLQNTTPANALTLTAIYPGTFGNQISVTVVADAKNPSTQMDLNVYVQGFLTETFIFNKTDATGLMAQINAANTGSKWLIASAPTSGVPFGVVGSPVSLTSGNDGGTLLSGDYTAMMTAFQVQRFGVFAVQDIASTTSWSDTTGSAILTSLMAWQKTLNTSGKRFMTVVGGSTADTATTAAARSATIADPNVINIGVGTIGDSVFGNLSTSQIAPRLAGIISARTEKQGLSFARLAGTTLPAGASDSDILAALSGGGFMTLARDSNADAPVRFEKGLTTFTVGTTAQPLFAYSNPKFVLTMQSLENELTAWAEANVIGQLPVAPTTVSYVLANLSSKLKQRETDQIIQPGWTIVQNPTPAPHPTDDFIAVLYGISFTRDTEQVLNTVVVQ